MELLKGERAAVAAAKEIFQVERFTRDDALFYFIFFYYCDCYVDIETEKKWAHSNGY